MGSDSVGSLAASLTIDGSINLTAPLSAGTYYYGACVDSVSGESDTNNNCSTGVRVTVSGGEISGSEEIRRLTYNLYDDYTPAWSPDGRSIAFTSNQGRGPYDSYDIYVINSDGSNQRRLTNNTFMPGADFSPTWSPDGRSIVFTSKRDRDSNNYEIYVMGADGSNQRRLTNNSDNDFAPSWSPDGRLIAFDLR